MGIVVSVHNTGRRMRSYILAAQADGMFIRIAMELSILWKFKLLITIANCIRINHYSLRLGFQKASYRFTIYRRI